MTQNVLHLAQIIYTYVCVARGDQVSICKLLHLACDAGAPGIAFIVPTSQMAGKQLLSHCYNCTHILNWQASTCFHIGLLALTPTPTACCRCQQDFVQAASDLLHPGQVYICMHSDLRGQRSHHCSGMGQCGSHHRPSHSAICDVDWSGF